MCFDMLWFVHLIILVAFIVALIAIARIWLPGWIADPRLAQTINIIIGLIVFCVVVWILYNLWICIGGGGFISGPYRR
jgi:threonine/homoserine/homoserine lactone efflux protein